MNPISFQFFIFSIGGLLLFHLKQSGPWRRAILQFLSIVFLASQAPGDLLHDWHAWVSLTPLLGFAVLGYAGLRLVRGEWWHLAAVATVLIVIFGYFKRYLLFNCIPFPASAVTMIGLSYVLFRILQITIDYAQGAMESMPSSNAFFGHLFAFYTFLSGPVWRFQDHQEQLTHLDTFRLRLDDAYTGFSRLINGALKLNLISRILEAAHISGSSQLLEAAYLNPHRFSFLYARTCFEFLLYIYFNFSGYMDLMIGLGQLFGLRLPENFNHPFASSNFLDLWNRWHITLSEFFKFYLFNPLVAHLTRRIGGKGRAPYLGALGYFATFFVMGLWHGSTLPFVIYGLLLGFGASVNKLWETLMTRQLGKTNALRIRAMQWYQISARSVTLVYFAMAFTLWLPIDLDAFASLVSLKSICATFLVGFVSVCLIQLLWLLVRSLSQPIMDWLTPLRSHPAWLEFHLGLRSLIVVWSVIIFSGSAPKFAYQVF